MADPIDGGPRLHIKALDPRLISSQDICPADVLLGRGKLVHHHAGNAAYRMDIKLRSTEYKALKCIGRDAVAREVFELVHRRGGRFLRRTSNEVLWEECPDRLALTKVKQALRDSIRQIVPTHALSQESVQALEGTPPGPASGAAHGYRSGDERTCGRHGNSNTMKEVDNAVCGGLLQRRSSDLDDSFSQTSAAKRARMNPTVFESLIPTKESLASSLQLPDHGAFTESTMQQSFPSNEHRHTSVPLLRLRQAWLYEPSHFQSTSFQSVTPMSQPPGPLVNGQPLLGSHLVDSSLRSSVPCLRPQASTSPCTTTGMGLPPGQNPFVDNEMALVLRRLREGYMGSSSTSPGQSTSQASMEDSVLK